LGKFIDLTGQRFGRLTVIKRTEIPKDISSQHTFWLCKCDCGNEIAVVKNGLVNGGTRSCGCLRRIDLTGRIFGNLTVTGLAEKPEDIKTGGAFWTCKCRCGNEKVIDGNSLRRGHSKSCGCHNKKLTSQLLLNDLTGKIFGKLTIVSRAENTRNGCVQWDCKCVCGNQKTIKSSNLLHGSTTSCGCTNHEWHKLPSGESSKRHLYYSYKKSAQERNIQFDLDEDVFFYLVQQNCSYCGTKPSTKHKSTSCYGAYIHNGIDRENNSDGYTSKNSVPCCKTCNVAKHSMSKFDFLSWVEKIHNYQKEKSEKNSVSDIN